LEPYEDREARWSSFSAQSRQRFGALVDTGAENNLCGSNWLTRFTTAFQLAVMWTASSASFSGVGSGRVPSEYQATFHVGLDKDYYADMCAQITTGSGAHLACLLGLTSMELRQTIIDLTAMIMSVLMPDHTRKALKLSRINGHLILPLDIFDETPGAPLPGKEEWLNDPLGLQVWLTEDVLPIVLPQEPVLPNDVLPIVLPHDVPIVLPNDVLHVLPDVLSNVLPVLQSKKKGGRRNAQAEETLNFPAPPGLCLQT